MALYGNNPIEAYTLTVGSAGTFSGSVFLNGNGILAVGNTGTFTAAPLTFQMTLGTVGPDAGGTWVNVYAGSVEYTIGTMYGTAVQFLPPADLPSVNWVRVRTGRASDNGGTLQTAAVNIVLWTRPI